MIREKRTVFVLRSFITQGLTARGGCACRKKPARELRQGGSNYRCCIPALAGFVSPQSIAPDGIAISAKRPGKQLGCDRFSLFVLSGTFESQPQQLALPLYEQSLASGWIGSDPFERVPRSDESGIDRQFLRLLIT